MIFVILVEEALVVYKPKKLIVLDFVTGSVDVYDFDENIYDQVEDYFIENEIDFTNVEYMLLDKLNIKIH